MDFKYTLLQSLHTTVFNLPYIHPFFTRLANRMASTTSEAAPGNLNKEKDKGGVVGLNDKFVALIDKVCTCYIIYQCLHNIHICIYIYILW